MKGYNQTTIEEIADGANFGKGSIYHYFRSKEEILDTIISDKTEELLNLIKVAYSNDFDPLLRLKSIILTIMGFLHDNLDFFIITIEHFKPFQSMPTSAPRLPNERFQDFFEKQNAILAEAIKECQQKGYLISMDIQEIIMILTGMINYTIIYWIKNRPSKDFIEWMNLGKLKNSVTDYFPKRVEDLLRIFLDGVIQEKC